MRGRRGGHALGRRVDVEAAAAILFSAPGDAVWLDGGARDRHLLARGERVALPTAGVIPALRAALAEPGALGLVGWLGYEAGHETVGVPAAPPGEAPGAWLRVQELLEVDPVTGHAEAHVGAGAPGSAVELAARWEAALAAAAPLAPPSDPAPSGPARWRDEPEAYRAAVAACLAAIREGEAYQLCLTTRVDVPGRFDPFAVHRRLRSATTSHHGALLRLGERALVSASPERFLEVRAGSVRSRPIKGTRPRSSDADEDARLAAELRADPKEQAENLMIVDLVRNDLSRVCTPGTVAVTGLHEVESYPPVHQLVSTVEGRLRPGLDALDALAALFPAGSMTGAPKRRAMQLLAELEGAPRGAYAGAFGWIGADGDADLAMTIRTIELDAHGASIGTGGGITAGSDPEREWREARLKARAPLAALGVVETD
ncbi:MAG: anthranilate synthase component I family protein [Actinomycetales bacterium]|nr:anthranilate synthase component I family protein [Actinomycetales bacterium]